MARKFTSVETDRVVIADHADLDATTAVTVEHWFYWDLEESNQPKHIVSKWNAYLTRISRKGTLFGHNFTIFDGASAFEVQGGDPVAGRWYHYGCTYDGTTLKIRVYDSVAKTTNNYTLAHTGGIDASANDIYIGNYESLSPSFDAVGSVGGLRIWKDLALSDAEIDMLRWQPGLNYRSPVVNMPLGRGSPEPDHSGNKHTGTVTGTTIERGIPAAYRGTQSYSILPGVSGGATTSIDSAAFTWTPTVVDSLRHHRTPIGTAAFSLTSNDVASLRQTMLSAETASYTLNLSDVGTFYNRNTPVDAAAYTLTPAAVGSLNNRVSIINSAFFFAFTSGVIDSLYNRRTLIDSTTFTITPQAVDSIYNSLGESTPIESAAFALTAEAVNSLYDRNTQALSATFAFTPVDVDSIYNAGAETTPIDSAAFTLTAEAIGSIHNRETRIESTAFNITVDAVASLYARTTLVDSANFLFLPFSVDSLRHNVTRIDSVLLILTANDIDSLVSGAVFGGVYNVTEVFPTGSNVTITLYDPITANVVALDSSACAEIPGTGVFIWDTSKLTAQPAGYQEYPYQMTDGVTTISGLLKLPDVSEALKIAQLYKRFDLDATDPNNYADDGSSISNSEFTLTKSDNGNGTFDIIKTPT